MYKVMSLLLTLTSVTALLGCGGGASSSSPAPVSGQVPDPTPTTTPTSGTVSPNQPTPQSFASDLQLFDYGDLQSNRAAITINVAEGNISFFLTARSSTADAVVGIEQVTAPDGNVIYQADLENNTVSGVLGSEPITNVSEVALLIPNSPQHTLQAGNYQVTVAASSGANLNGLRVFLKSGDLMDTSEISFTLWLTMPDTALQSAFNDNALTKANFESVHGEALARHMNDIMTVNRLQVSGIRYIVASASEQTAVNQALENFNPDSESDPFLADICTLMNATSANVADRAIHLVWLPSLPQDIAGIAPGLPGVALDSNAKMQCVVASFDAYGNSLIEHAANFVHEAGHFMALPHTTESDGAVFDLFSDTPQCDAATYDGRNNTQFMVEGAVDGEVTDHECSFDGGANNFIFYSGHIDFAPYIMSAQQADVLRVHPLFKPAI